MNVLRDNPVRRLSAALAGLALYLQLAFAGPGMLTHVAPPDAVGALAEHALCLASESGTKPQPANNAPTLPGHDHTLFCCLWHPLPGVAPQTAAAPLPVAYATVAHGELGSLPIISGPSHGPGNARAPPTLA
jgi:hypothetical protein